MDDNPSGSALLLRWREAAPAERSQAKIGAALGIGQSAISEWQTGSRRPDLANALALEDLTGGEVPAESWGHSRTVVDRVLSVASRRADRSDAEAPPDAASEPGVA